MASHRPVIGSKWRAEAARSTSVQILAALLALSASLLPASATAADSNGFVGEAELTKALSQLAESTHFTTTTIHRLNSLGYVGVAPRLRVFLNKLISGKPVAIGVVGGSISAGQGCGGPKYTYAGHLFNWIQQHFPNEGHVMYNAAIAGTTSPYMSACVDNHLNPDHQLDLVLVEYSMNDRSAPDSEWEEPERHAFERMLRKLLVWRGQPALVLVHMYSPCKVQPCGQYWQNAERDFGELAKYYSLPEVSLKAGLYHLMMEQTRRAQDEGRVSPPPLKLKPPAPPKKDSKRKEEDAKGKHRRDRQLGEQDGSIDSSDDSRWSGIASGALPSEYQDNEWELGPSSWQVARRIAAALDLYHSGQLDDVSEHYVSHGSSSTGSQAPWRRLVEATAATAAILDATDPWSTPRRHLREQLGPWGQALLHHYTQAIQASQGSEAASGSLYQQPEMQGITHSQLQQERLHSGQRGGSGPRLSSGGKRLHAWAESLLRQYAGELPQRGQQVEQQGADVRGSTQPVDRAQAWALGLLRHYVSQSGGGTTTPDTISSGDAEAAPGHGSAVVYQAAAALSLHQLDFDLLDPEIDGQDTEDALVHLAAVILSQEGVGHVRVSGGSAPHPGRHLSSSRRAAEEAGEHGEDGVKEMSKEEEEEERRRRAEEEAQARLKAELDAAEKSPERYAHHIFFSGKNHPGHDGHRIVGEMVITLMLRVMRDMSDPAPTWEEVTHESDAPLPPPLVEKNYAWPTSVCLMGSRLRDQVVSELQGFSYVNESFKYGFVSTQPGSWIQLVINTTSPAGVSAKQKVTVQIAMLQSYEHMGMAAFECVSGCSCKPSLFDGYTPVPVSLEIMHTIKVSQADACAIRIRSEHRTSSPDKEHKVKVCGVVISEETGDHSAAMIHGKLRMATKSDGQGAVVITGHHRTLKQADSSTAEQAGSTADGELPHLHPQRGDVSADQMGRLPRQHGSIARTAASGRASARARTLQARGDSGHSASASKGQPGRRRRFTLQ